MIKASIFGGAIAAAMLAAAPAQAADNYLFGYSGGSMVRQLELSTTDGPVVISYYDTGWYRGDGFHSPENDNYIVGHCDSCSGLDYNDFFVFDLANVSGTVTGATLSAFNPDYISGVLSTWSLWDVSTSIDTLLAGAPSLDPTGLASFSDLETGTLFGSREITNVLDGTLVSVDLNADAVAAINGALGGYFAIGGTLREGHVIPGVPGVPEPASWAMMIAGFGIAGAAMRRRVRTVRFA